MDWDSVTASKHELVSDWNYHKLIPFLKLDNRGEVEEGNHCVGGYKGGWWYVWIFLNGEYENQAVESFMSIYVNSFKSIVALERSRMMFRPQNDVRPDFATTRARMAEHVNIT